ncbi:MULTISPECIES: hypothetical protein [Hafniaceae]|jgi:hypothetical protein|uniref:hypothetical protein n=1 Tax=Hafniaceae TaxID=1903412 RepID=UPI00187D2897|nr:MULTISPECIES: hypothetical protein [Hafniaceae]DAZ31481.1 MAG TPA: hypothetical protein [Caudoviricetes sp.]MCE9882437.1 hypothetical protein [Hafnia paralvei]MCE9906039.1 hypothetical protein [Hafnia paralvei]MCE9910029.1 hypothetical protein [Hafnia paralvei]MCV9377311.1 hypothetical protein [Hafnia alvei]
MQLALAGQSASGCSTNYLLKIQHHPSNRLTSASFTPPPRKSWLDKLVDMLRQEGRP